MSRLLVIADDFTGALDTGVQFKAKGTLIRVARFTDKSVLGELGEKIQVLIINAETRRMTPEKAYEAVHRIVTAAMEARFDCIYKKTDSGLRGNIGSELTGMLDASGERRLHFIPAFPKMGRSTVDGIHYIEGVPVADSVFGGDPFEPVCHSGVQDIIAEQSGVSTCVMKTGAVQAHGEGIVIYDAASDEDLVEIAADLKKSGQLHLLAGCAGFASVLPELLGLEQSDGRLPSFHPALLTICGSINPITIGQMDTAEDAGMLRIRLTPRQKLEPGWPDSPEGAQCIADWLAQAQSRGGAIIECGVEGNDETRQYIKAQGLALEQLRSRIAAAMGGVLKGLLDQGLEATLLVTGGDTLLAFLEQIDQEELTPIGELMPGVVLSEIRYRNKAFNLISKSGGFGPPTVLTDLECMIRNPDKEELIC